ncbi:MAG: DUF11 domain-containing protein [Acidobacteria bacterium]|nr:DUF11 domain-containing protein [Acidobacteriota bacterium]
MRKVLLIAALIAVAAPLSAFDTNTCSGDLCIQPISWNIIGLDSNAPTTSGPNEFMVGARVCNTSPTVTLTNVTTKLWWLSVNAAIGLSDIDTIAIPELKPGICNDFYYNGLVTRAKANHNTSRNYRVSVWADQAPAVNLGTAPWLVTGAVATPIERQLYVEKLVSQNRNQVLGISGPTDVFVGGIYTYEVDWSTATGGYEQIEHFVNLRNNTFRLLESHTDYAVPTGATNDSIYGDACGWDDLITSGTYRSCIGPTNYSGGKAGGSTITSWFTVKILGAGSGTLTTLIYDYSGSSYHYNSDYGQAYNSLLITAQAASDLQITISDSPDPATIGSTITYTGTVTNAGLSPVLSTDAGKVTFTIPAGTSLNTGGGALSDGVDFGAQDSDWSCSTSGSTVTCTLIGNMTDQVPATAGTFDAYVANYTFGVTVLSGTTGTAMLAAASVTSNLVDSYPSNNAATTTTYFAAPTDADLAVTNVVSSPVVTDSGTVTFTQTLTNNGPASATDPVFTTTVPSGSDLTAFTPESGWTCGVPAPPVTLPLAGPATITCTADSGTLSSGSSAQFLLTITETTATDGSALTSTATVSSATRDPNSSNNLASATTYKVANGSANLEITVTDNPDPVVAGETILYDNCIRNNGPTASVATYSYTLPANTTFTYVDYPAGWSCTTPNVGSAGTVSCTSNSALPADPDICYELDVVVTVSSTYPLSSVPYSATLTGSVPDSVSPNVAVESTALAAASSSDLSISKSAPANASVGTPMTYSIVVTNNGPAAAPPNTTVTDSVPVAMTINSVSSPCTVLGQDVSCVFTSAIPVGGVQVITINVTPNSGAGSTITNSATVANASDPVAGNNTATADTFIYAATVATMFEAAAARNGDVVEIDWNTSFEVDNLGFNLYREAGASRQQVNPSLIAGSALIVGQGSQFTAGFSYHSTDRAPVEGSVYWIESIALDGTTVWHGPIVPRDGSLAKSLMRSRVGLRSRCLDRRVGEGVRRRPGAAVRHRGDERREDPRGKRRSLPRDPGATRRLGLRSRIQPVGPAVDG